MTQRRRCHQAQMADAIVDEHRSDQDVQSSDRELDRLDAEAVRKSQNDDACRETDVERGVDRVSRQGEVAEIDGEKREREQGRQMHPWIRVAKAIPERDNEMACDDQELHVEPAD